MILLAAVTALLASAGVADARSDKNPSHHKLAKPGTVVSAKPLKRSLWVPGTTRSAFALKYVSKNAFDQRALTTGTVFLPRGRMPHGGWPVISWAHGTVGLGDGCAPVFSQRLQSLDSLIGQLARKDKPASIVPMRAKRSRLLPTLRRSANRQRFETIATII